MTKSKKITFLAEILLHMLFILSSSIALPILFRSFYALHITPLQLCEYTGLSKGEILSAFHAMMDFCIGKTNVFSAGGLPFSAQGAAHFQDVRVLFLLNLGLLFTSGTMIVILFLFRRRVKQAALPQVTRHNSRYWAAIILIFVIIVLVIFISVDFDRAFILFHTIFFPGKENWMFDWRTDPIILILPQEFFRNCAILIGGALFLQCGFAIVIDRKKRLRN